MKYIIGSFVGFVGFVIIGLILAVTFDLYNYTHLMNDVSSGNQEKIKSDCLDSWYQGSDLKDLPVPCLKYYQK